MSTHSRNLRLYPWYVGGIAFYAWMPVFFLYMSAHVSLSDVLVLEAIYYAAIVMLELPSGYFSDHVGRRPTLVIAAVALVAAYAVFAFSASFTGFAIAQVLLATGLAFNSGTDTSFHLASLKESGLDHEYGGRESRLTSLVFVLGALSAIAGGVVGSFDLKLAYVVSGVGAIVSLLAALAFAPVHDTDGEVPDDGFVAAVGSCIRIARSRDLGWVFAVVVAATVLNHVPYEFYQPYLASLENPPWPTESTPLVAGVHMAVVQFIAAPAANWSSRLVDRIGLVPHLLFSIALQGILIASMAYFAHPLIALLLVARSMPRALQDAPVRAAVAPRVPPSLRATYLSLQSLAGRLGFAVLLFALSWQATEAIEIPLQIASVVAAVLFAILVALAVLKRPRFSS